MDVARFNELILERDRELGVDRDMYSYGGAVSAMDQFFNGKPDTFEVTDVVQVMKVPVEKYEWKVV